MSHQAYIDYTHRFFDRWSPLYDLFALPIAWLYRAAARLLVPRPGTRVLDLCTGTGEVALRCARRGGDVTAVDITASMLERAKRKCAGKSVQFETLDARSLPWPDRHFDTVGLSFALHDMPHRVRLEVLRQAARVACSRLVVVDYETPRSSFLGRLSERLIASYETAYFPGFSREGGALPHLREAGLEPTQIRSLYPLPFVLLIVDRITEDPGDKLPSSPATRGEDGVSKS